MTATDLIGHALTALGAGGLGAIAQKWIAARTKDRIDARKERVELERIETQREDTQTHATERAFEDLREILREEREAHRLEREDCGRRLTKLEVDLEALRLENDALKTMLAESQALITTLRADVERMRAQWLRDYAGEDLKTTAVGRKR